MSYAIVPALIPTDRAAVIEFAKQVSFAREIQIDVVDGIFVPHTSWPYDPADEPKAIKSATDVFTLEVDLMVSNPIVAAHQWIDAGADMLVFHIESVELEVFRNFVSTAPKNVSIGVACHGETPLTTLLSYIPCAEYVQLMGIAEIGAQGQSFDRTVLTKITQLREKCPDLMISIDGSVNENTIVELKKAGAHRFVSGSAITKAADKEAAYLNLNSLVN